MSGKLVFLRRTTKEMEIFGGEVFIDINGKNIGILGKDDIEIELPEGIYKIKMYKSHKFDTFIGNAESDINLNHDEKLLVKYSPPMLVNQSGNIVISNYVSEQQLENLARKKEEQLVKEDLELKEQKKEQDEKIRNGWIIFWVLMFGGMLIWFLIEISTINSFSKQ